MSAETKELRGLKGRPSFLVMLSLAVSDVKAEFAHPEVLPYGRAFLYTRGRPSVSADNELVSERWQSVMKRSSARWLQLWRLHDLIFRLWSRDVSCYPLLPFELGIIGLSDRLEEQIQCFDGNWMILIALSDLYPLRIFFAI